MMSEETRQIIQDEVKMFNTYLASLPYRADRDFIKRLKAEKNVNANQLKNARYGYIRFSYSLKQAIEELAGKEIFSKEEKYVENPLKYYIRKFKG